MSAAAAPGCPLCDGVGGRLVFSTARWRLVHAEEPGFPGFYRVVWNAHVAEFSQLAPPARAECLDAVVAVEEAMRRHLHPTKVNLAALGNMVAHLHWHVVARYDWDSHFPAAVWAPALRQPDAQRLAALSAALPTLEQELRERFARPA